MRDRKNIIETGCKSIKGLDFQSKVEYGLA